MQLLLQVYTIRFETLHLLMSWPEGMNVLRIKFFDSVISVCVLGHFNLFIL